MSIIQFDLYFLFTSKVLMHRRSQDKANYVDYSKKLGIRTKNKFTPEEDKRLEELVEEFGENSWEEITEQMEGRNVRQCKDRWTRYLSPNVNKSKWTPEEEKLLIKLVKDLNFRWVQISKHFKGRTDNQIKNKWNILKKHVHITKKPKSRQVYQKTVKVYPEYKQPNHDVNVLSDSVNSSDCLYDDSAINFISHLDSGYFEDMFASEANQELIQLFGF